MRCRGKVRVRAKGRKEIVGIRNGFNSVCICEREKERGTESVVAVL